LNSNYRGGSVRISVKINDQITSPELRVLVEGGENLGVISLAEALAVAKEKGLDLVEIVPTAKPPVAKIISFDKFRYEREKELKKQKQQSKAKELKQVQISARAAKNDLLFRVKQAEKFIEAGHKVEIRMRLRGREKANRDWAKKKMEEFLLILPEDYKPVSEIRFDNFGLNVQIDKKQK
jgi:translation initiation factor IF-3